jgi:hypothetical protein
MAAFMASTWCPTPLNEASRLAIASSNVASVKLTALRQAICKGGNHGLSKVCLLLTFPCPVDAHAATCRFVRHVHGCNWIRLSSSFVRCRKANPSNSPIWNEVKEFYLRGGIIEVGDGLATDFWREPWMIWNLYLGKWKCTSVANIR